MNTFIVVNITRHVRDNLEDKSMIVHSKKALPLPSVYPGKDYTGTHLKEELCDLSWKLPGYSHFHTGRVGRGWWALC